MKGILYNKYRNSKAHKDYLIYANQHNVTKTKVRQAQMQYEQSLFQRLRSTPKAFMDTSEPSKRLKIVLDL